VTSVRANVFICLAAILALELITETVSAVDHQPNIVVILADDFGVGDIQAHFPAHPIPTPNLDRLVRQGMSFTDAHSPSAVCSPTRYGLLTGRYAWRTRLQEWVLAAYEPPLIAADRLTLPEFLATQGYRTACFGKWHLGWDWPGKQPARMLEPRNAQWTMDWEFTRPISGGPTARGFDTYFGVDLPNMPPFTYIEQDRIVGQPTDNYEPDPTEGVFLPKSGPMAPGWRMKDILPEITSRAARHIRHKAAGDKPFFVYVALTSPHEPVVPTERFRGQSGIAPVADFLMETDWAVGEVLRAIDDSGVTDKTIVMFTADNGHSHYTGWDELVAAGHRPSGPYRGHKGDIWEGGHRVPLIVRWPGRVAPGSRSDSLVCLTDLFATCADAVGAPLPSAAGPDSFSFMPSLIGTPADHSRTTLVSHSNDGEFAYRDGSWKLVLRNRGPSLHECRGLARTMELYNLSADVGETNDLVSRHPDIVSRLKADLQVVIEQGSSHRGRTDTNDTSVRCDITQTARWAPATE